MTDYFEECLRVAPVCYSLWRSLECKLYSSLDLNPPILDLGCGDGLFASILFKKPIEAGIDISNNDIIMAKRTGIYKSLKFADATKKIPYGNRHFSTVISNCVLEHIDNLDGLLAEVNRVLKKGGLFVFSVPSVYISNLLWTEPMKKVGLSKVEETIKIIFNIILKQKRFFSKEEWRRELKKYGFNVVSFRYYAQDPIEKIWSIFCFFDFWRMIFKMLFKRYYIFPSFKRNILSPIEIRLLRKFYFINNKIGSGLFVVSKKIHDIK